MLSALLDRLRDTTPTHGTAAGKPRTVLIAQRRDELRRGNLPPTVRTWVRLTSFTLGYGYPLCQG
jgi:hypothetical protein